MKGPAYTEDETNFLEGLARRDESPTKLAEEYISRFGHERSKAALVQKIRKLSLDSAKSKGKKVESGAKRRGRPPKVNTAPISDAPAAPRRGRPPKSLSTVPTALKGVVSNGNGHSNGHSNDVVVEFKGIKLSGSPGLVGEFLQRLA